MATKSEILAPLNDAQKALVTDYKGLIALEACPGSGKTYSIIATIAYMIKDGVKPSRILAFTFTKKAANELSKRLHSFIGADADHVMTCTYHSFCGKLLRCCAEYAGRSSNFSIFDEDDKKKVLDAIVKEYFKGLGAEPMKYSVVANYIGNFKMDNLSPSEAKISRSDTSYGKASAFIYESYENKMREMNAFDFDDLPFFAYRIVKTYPEVLEAVSQRFDYIISDENQDSNNTNIQLELLLASHFKNLIMVGDTDQSIYGWRGADVNNVMDIIKQQGFRTKFLSTNYRSTKTIVNAANGVISHNKNRIEKSCDTANEEGEKIDVVYTDSCAKEAEYIAKKIKILRDRNPNLRYKDFAVLSRTQVGISKLEERFLLEHIPYCTKGKVPFYARAEIKDILSYLKFALNPKDVIAFERIINVPKRGFGDTTLKKFVPILLSQKTFCDIIKCTKENKQLRLNKKAQNGIKEFNAIILNLCEKIEQNTSPDELVKYIIEATAYEQYLNDTVKNAETLDSKKLNLNELITLAASFDSVEELMDSATIDTSDSDEFDNIQNDKVSLMTLHGSKGLEFPVVILAGANDNNIPHIMCHKDDLLIQEERRLMYVGMTRAENKLIITVPCNMVNNLGLTQHVKPSRFLSELPSQYLNKYKY